jgi:CMP-2-keto-3-deoxyoctulosonic acid synthetase
MAPTADSPSAGSPQVVEVVEVVDSPQVVEVVDSPQGDMPAVEEAEWVRS